MWRGGAGMKDGGGTPGAYAGGRGRGGSAGACRGEGRGEGEGKGGPGGTRLVFEAKREGRGMNR